MIPYFDQPNQKFETRKGKQKQLYARVKELIEGKSRDKPDDGSSDALKKIENLLKIWDDQFSHGKEERYFFILQLL